MNCPTCKIPLVMSDRQGIEIDYCPECRGIWLDRGELDKIIERSLKETQSSFQPNQQSYNNQSQQGYYEERKKKHWLNELFDQ